MTLERGTLINNRYRIVEILGQGGMGSVYRAIDENLGVEVAVKDNLFTTEEYARQFRREAVILASLRHPNLPRVTDHFVIEDQGQYLVMDYIEGEDLRQRMDRVGVISEEEAILIGAAICDALSYLDSRTQPIVHRDIKPGNVKITPQGQIYLVDFGLAKIWQGSEATTTGARAMTPGYSPPEQYGTARTDNRSDLFSLGATLYAALTGAIPEDALARAMDQTELTTIRKRNPKISRRLAAVLEKSLEIRPDNRYQTAEEFKRALLNVRGMIQRKTGEFTVTPPPNLPSEPHHELSYLPSGSSPAGLLENGSQHNGFPLPVSPPISERPSDYRSRPRPRRRKGGGLLALGFIVVLFIGTAFIYLFNPDLLSATANKISSSFGGILTARGGAEDTVTPAAFLNITSTWTPTPTQGVTPSPTATLLPATPTPASPPAVILPATTTPTFAPTLVGGGGGVVAYASDETGTTQVWTIDIDGKNARQITTIAGGACQPDWSPDGKRLVFISPCERNQEEYPGAGMFLINADGTGLQPLPSSPGGDFDPAWSPDGKQIAFTSLRNGGRPRIYLFDLDGKEGNQVVQLSGQYVRDSQPAWSPDGKKIVFISNRNGYPQIWIMNADGSDPVPFSRYENKVDSHPVWSPDGKTILFTQTDMEGGSPGITAASIDEHPYREYPFSLGPLPIREARYSADGFWLVFESWPKGGNHDIYIMSATGTGAGRDELTDSPRIDFDPVWRPVKVP